MQKLANNEDILVDENKKDLELLLDIEDEEFKVNGEDSTNIESSLAVISCARKMYNAMMQRREKEDIKKFLSNENEIYKEVVDVEKCLIKVQAKVREIITKRKVDEMRQVEHKLLGLNLDSRLESKEKQLDFLNYLNRNNNDIILNEIKLHEDLKETLNLLRDVYYGIHTTSTMKPYELDLTTIISNCQIQSRSIMRLLNLLLEIPDLLLIGHVNSTYNLNDHVLNCFPHHVYLSTTLPPPQQYDMISTHLCTKEKNKIPIKNGDSRSLIYQRRRKLSGTIKRRMRPIDIINCI
uniref:Uncharacterized protein n=1 Tax=Strongyloides papillosus TaxID=174720 RepID=A0A0N5BF90_STREA